MSSALFALYLIILISGSEAAGGQCKPSEKSVNGKALKGHKFKDVAVKAITECQNLCESDHRCHSYNYYLPGMVCEMNSETKETKPYDFVTDDQRFYMKREVINSCIPSPCKNGGTCEEDGKSYKCSCLPGFKGSNCEVAIAKSCSDLKMLNQSAESGNYIIDADDEENLQAFEVYCNLTDRDGVGVTVISHGSESRTLVDGCDKPGCYLRDIHYAGASLSQLASLTRVSSYCEQFISYECYGSVLFEDGHAYGWWVSRDSINMTYWGGAIPGSGKCACGMNNSCVDLSYGCNCDKNDPVWRDDSGLLSDKSRLPVKQLRFGDVGNYGLHYDEMGYHTLGKLRCYGIT